MTNRQMFHVLSSAFRTAADVLDLAAVQECQKATLRCVPDRPAREVSDAMKKKPQDTMRVLGLSKL